MLLHPGLGQEEGGGRGTWPGKEAFRAQRTKLFEATLIKLINDVAGPSPP